MRYPVRKVFITQDWGNDLVINGDHVYRKFGLKGHNGLDLRIFDDNGIKASKGKLIAPHRGVVKEARFSDGYGWYYKIENEKEGSILAHNTTLFLKAGDTVEEGQIIGTTGNSGFSTSPHLHWGYYLIPRDRSNGYGGTINQVPLIGKEDMADDALQTCLDDRQKFWDERDDLHRALEVDNQDDALKEIAHLKAVDKKWEGHECPKCPEVPVIETSDEVETGSKKYFYDSDGKLVVEKTYKPAVSTE